MYVADGHYLYRLALQGLVERDVHVVDVGMSVVHISVSQKKDHYGEGDAKTVGLDAGKEKACRVRHQQCQYHVEGEHQPYGTYGEESLGECFGQLHVTDHKDGKDQGKCRQPVGEREYHLPAQGQARQGLQGPNEDIDIAAQVCSYHGKEHCFHASIFLCDKSKPYLLKKQKMHEHSDGRMVYGVV